MVYEEIAMVKQKWVYDVQTEVTQFIISFGRWGLLLRIYFFFPIIRGDAQERIGEQIFFAENDSTWKITNIIYFTRNNMDRQSSSFVVYYWEYYLSASSCKSGIIGLSRSRNNHKMRTR